MQGTHNNTHFTHERSCKYLSEPVRQVSYRKVFVYLANPCIATYYKGKLSRSKIIFWSEHQAKRTERLCNIYQPHQRMSTDMSQRFRDNN